MFYNLFLIGSLLFVFVLLVVITSAFLGFLLTRVPFVPTRAGDIEFIVKELGVSRKDVFYDLGCGNGKVVFMVENLSGAKTLGFELTWWTYIWAQLKKIIIRSKARFVNKNFFKADWGEATIVYGYLYPMLMRQVQEKFVADCKAGTLAVIRDFPFPDLKPEKVFHMPKKHEIYVYKI